MTEPQMFLYVISVFLAGEKFSSTAERLRSLGFSVREEDACDQTGEVVRTFQVNAGGVRILLSGANDFHRDGDFEIGLTTQSKSEWKRFIEAAAKIGMELDCGEMESDTDSEPSLYAIPKSEHCPFFFLFDGGKSDITALTKVRATMTKENLLLYEEKIRPMLGTSLAEKLHFSEGERFLIQSVEISGREMLSFEKHQT